MIDEDEPKRIDLLCPHGNILVEAKVQTTVREPLTPEAAERSILPPCQIRYPMVRNTRRILYSSKDFPGLVLRSSYPPCT
jgi:hypothetical protein